MKIIGRKKILDDKFYSRQSVCQIFISFIFAVTILVALLYFGIFAQKMMVQAETAQQLITTRTGLASALSNAVSGDTIYVDDIDFNYPATSHNQFERLTINKSITIKSGKPNSEPAMLTGGSFIIAGQLTESSKINCLFDGIIFDGGIDAKTLSDEDWLPAPPNHYTTEPEKAQYAVTFSGHVNAVFSDCVFTRYMYQSGGAFWCEYGEFDLNWEPNDNRLCKIDIALNNCNFTDNAAYSRGGAVYLRAYNGNVSFKAENCTFENNICADEGEGGGAIFSAGALIALKDCKITGNIANYSYGQVRPLMDFTEGGGMLCNLGSLDMINCIVAENTASNGGGIALHDIKTKIDGCVIAANNAFADTEYFDLGMGYSSMGRGGGIFAALNPYSITMINTSIYDNTALNAYGGLYVYYEDWYTPESGYGDVALVFCTYINNGLSAYGNDEMRWDDSGDLWQIPHISTFGCIVIDGDFDSIYPRYIIPSEENGYCYFASPNTALADSYLPILQAPSSIYTQVYISPQDGSSAIPSSAVQALMSGKFSGSVGTFYVGSNYNPSVLIRIDAAGGLTENEEIIFNYGDTLSLSASRTGYDFDGWFTESGSVFMASGLAFAPGIDIYSITAKWTAKTYNVKFMVNGEAVEKTQTYDSPWIFPDASKNGYKFMGWFTGENGGGQRINPDNNFVFSDEGGITLYAYFNKDFPILAVVLISVSVLILIMAAVFVIARKRKSALQQAASESASPDLTATENGSLDRLAMNYNLTAREKEIVSLLASAKPPMAIAEELFISVETVKKHIKNVYEKLDIHRKYELLEKLRNS